MILRFRYIKSDPADGFTNMAVDEVLLEGCRRGGVEGAGRVDGVLRLYEWSPPAVSLGHSQPIDIVDVGHCLESGVDIVRRVTGGGAVLHWEEITYCLMLNRRTQPGLRWPHEFTEMTGAILCEALRGLGIEALPAPRQRRVEQSAGSGRPSLLPVVEATSSICFTSGADYEVLVRGRKLAGSAHKFTKEAYFSHGSILTGRAHLKIANLMRADLRNVALPALRERSISMSEILPKIPGLEELGVRLTNSIETRIGGAFVESRLSKEEEKAVEELALEKRRCTVPVRAEVQT